MQIGNKNSRNYWILLALAVLFIGPLIAAISFYYSGSRWVPSTINYGELLPTPISFQAIKIRSTDGKAFNQQQFTGKWLLMYVGDLPCSKHCRENLYKMRQVRLALYEDAPRVDRLIVTTPIVNSHELEELIQKEYPGTVQAAIVKVNLAKFSELMNREVHKHGQEALYLVDPLGNVIMHYDANANPSGILKDVKRLKTYGCR